LVAVAIWEGDCIKFEYLSTDKDILSLCEDADVVAIDAPFSYPIDFKTFVSRWVGKELDSWDEPALLNKLMFRITDNQIKSVFRACHKSKNLLSASTSLLGIVTIRAARLIAKLKDTHLICPFVVEPIEKVKRVIEVYPAIAIAQTFGTRFLDYRTDKELADRLKEMFEPSLRKTNPGIKITWTTEFPKDIEYHDELDALMSVILAGHFEKLIKPDSNSEHFDVIRCTEGWIYYPDYDWLTMISHSD
jgi:predicted nuclease with RNAse H fold